MSDLDLKQYSLFGEFNDEDCEAVSELLEERTVWQGRAVFREGEEADGLVLIASGRVGLESKRGVPLSGLGPGSFFGGVSLMVVGKRECSVLAETECTVWTLQRSAYRRLVDDAPRTACRLAEAVMLEFAGSVRERLDDVVPALAVPDAE